jgi:hypothetical protein
MLQPPPNLLPTSLQTMHHNQSLMLPHLSRLQRKL